MKMIDCKHFNGYKPCGKSDSCDKDCRHLNRVQTRIIIVHLEALGAVLRATSVLPAIKRKYPSSHITWVTKGGAKMLLQENPFIDEVKTTGIDTFVELQTQRFDIGFCIDKSKEAWGYLKPLKVTQNYGFRVEEKSGSIVPSTAHANELWEIGLSDQLKFFENKKTECQLITESLGLEYKKDEYVLQLTREEIALAQTRKRYWQGAESQTMLVGFNTGCAPTIPYKKLTVDYQAKLAAEVLAMGNTKVVLLGGPEDTLRNQEIQKLCPEVILSPTKEGLRDGLCSMQACDLVVSGDSLGMHMAIALKKWVVAWFGPTCAHEIELFGRGKAILTDVPCSPCWKRTCQMQSMCYDQVSPSEMISAIEKGIQWHTSLYRQPLSEICF